MKNRAIDCALQLFESLIRNLGSIAGLRLRRWYYRVRLKECGKNLNVDCGVYFVNPEYIRLGDNVVLDKNVILIAGPSGDTQRTRCIKNEDSTVTRGEVRVGSWSHIGIGTIIQGHGGVQIDDYFTSSSRCMIYSLSNNPNLCHSGTLGGALNEVHYVETPVRIGRNVWLGLQCIVIGNSIGDNVFMKPNSVVVSNIASNQIAEGNPAKAVGVRFCNLSSENSSPIN